jgi:hypothetical protein
MKPDLLRIGRDVKIVNTAKKILAVSLFLRRAAIVAAVAVVGLDMLRLFRGAK